ncbi:MAG: DUF1844 domain-containing protein [Actinomycetota bacterium]|nr:DUF1844 domain-containing protein [Actinomycetota bacterium]
MSADAPAAGDGPPDTPPGPSSALRDLADVPAVEVVSTVAVHLMSAAAVKLGLGDEAGNDEAGDTGTGGNGGAGSARDLDEARALITALAGLVTAALPHLGTQHAAPLRDGLRSLQLAFREASVVPDAPGEGPGERFTGPVWR